jgi:hypothetical protein
MKVKKAILVYQAGIANVFSVDCYNLANEGRNARRLFQGSFTSAVHFARGLAAAGVQVKTAACNRAGDIANAPWSEDFDSMPFSDSFVILDENHMKPDYFIYRGGLYCEACAAAIKERLRAEGHEPANSNDERSFNSDEWPKGPFSDEESDSPQHCAIGEHCLAPTEIDGKNYGQFFENPLTTEGERYVKDEASEGPVKDFWMRFYDARH